MVLVDDSIVRGTTSMKIVEMVRNAGATRGAHAHRRAADHPSCFYGIDTPERDKLLAARYDVAGMAKLIGVDSLAFISIDGLYRAMGQPRPRPGARRSSATPASPATIRSRSTTRRRRGSPALAPRRRARLSDRHMTAAAAGRLAGASRWSPAPRAASARRRRWPCPRRRALRAGRRAPSGGARGARRPDQGSSAARATLVPLDLTDGAGIDRLGAALYERCGRLDVLVGNAGMLGTLSPLGHIDAEDLGRGDGGQRHRQLAPDPLLRSAAAPLRRRPRDLRHLGRRARRVAYWGAYAASKAALDMLVGIYAAEVAHTTVRVNLFNPGAMRTRMRAEPSRARIREPASRPTTRRCSRRSSRWPSRRATGTANSSVSELGVSVYRPTAPYPTARPLPWRRRFERDAPSSQRTRRQAAMNPLYRSPPRATAPVSWETLSSGTDERRACCDLYIRSDRRCKSCAKQTWGFFSPLQHGGRAL